jgi:hypothetical protein
MTAPTQPTDALTSYERGLDDAAALVMNRYREACDQRDKSGLMDRLIIGYVITWLACLRTEIIALKEREG